MLTRKYLEREKEDLAKQYEDFKEKLNQVLGALMWVNQALEKMKNANAAAGAGPDHPPSEPAPVGQLQTDDEGR